MKHKKTAGMLLILALLTSALTFSALAEEAANITDMTTFVFDGDTVTVKEGTDVKYEVTIYDSTDTESAAITSADSDGNTVYTVPSGSNGELLVSIKKSGGSYVFQGQGNGSIAVKKEATGDAYIYLNNLDLTSKLTSVITVKKDSTAACAIYAVEGTTNTLTDNEYNIDDGNLAAEKSVLKFKDGSNITITGGGIINIQGNSKNGIKASNILNITGDVQLNIDTVDNGISAENTINISGGQITIKTYQGDGIKACADYESVGDINITGGNITIDTYADGIQAMKNLTITGGTFDITTFGGHDITASGYDKDDDAYPSAKGLKASGSYFDASGNEVDASGCELQISGGTFLIDAADDGVHSDGNVTITGGDLTIASGDDGIHADYVNSVGIENGSDVSQQISITACVEGIEGATVNIYSGITKIFASDDCVNAANSDLTGYEYKLNIYGGNLYAASTEGDCLDSNGDLSISGGVSVLLGAIGGNEPNAALDCDGTFTLTGGTVLAIGQSEMSEVPQSGQSYVTWTSEGMSTAISAGSQGNPGTGYFNTLAAGPSGNQIDPGNPGNGNQPGQGGTQNGFISNGNTITIYDADGNKLISTVANWDYIGSNLVNYVFYSSPDVESGASYTLDLEKTTGEIPNETPDESDEAELPFEDVSESEWFYSVIKYVYENGIMVGTSDTLFEPNITVSRAMVVTTLWRIEGEPLANQNNPFTDVNVDWYEEAIAWAAENKIVLGYGDELFGPEDAVTREQMATILYRYAEYSGADVSAQNSLNGYTDAQLISSYALQSMQWANAMGLITGRTGTTLEPDGTATRAELAAVLCRYLTQ